MKDYTNSQISHLIDEHIHSERDRAILKRRLIDGVLYEPLAEEFGLSVVQTKILFTSCKIKFLSSCSRG